jgi:hypothetical protein
LISHLKTLCWISHLQHYNVQNGDNNAGIATIATMNNSQTGSAVMMYRSALAGRDSGLEIS